MKPTLEHVVVVGAGLAGHTAAERLRERGFRGAITVVGDEVHRPYNRTPLSKQLLTGEYTVRDLALPAFNRAGLHLAPRYRRHRPGCRRPEADPVRWQRPRV